MKVKLLKKIRKRFSWRIDSDNIPILIDKKYKTFTEFDIEHLKKLCNYTKEDVIDKVKIDISEWGFRWMKSKMLEPFGYSWARTIYSKQLRISKNVKNASLKN